MTSAAAAAAADSTDAAAVNASATSIPIGIDLGHSYSVIGVWRNDNTDIIANELGNRSTPNIVAFTDKEVLYGEPAHTQLATNLPNTLHHIKRLTGLHYHHPTVQSMKAKVDYAIQPVKPATDQTEEEVAIAVTYKGEQATYSAQQLLAVMLGKLKAVADRYTGTDCKQCVLAAPSNFSPTQRAALLAAGREAGLDVLAVLNEATAAAIAFDLDLPVPSKTGKSKENIAVVDVGGATTTVTLLQTEQGVLTHKSSTTDVHLGGDDFDQLLVDHFTREFQRQAQANLTQSHRAVARLSVAVERAKRVLSSSTSASIELDGLYEGEDFYSKISRARFETLAAPLFRRLTQLIQRSLQHANLTPQQVDHVLLIGGSARIPKVSELVKAALGKEARKGVNPEEAVAIGCTRQASLLVGRGKEWEAVNHAEESEKRGELALAYSLSVEGDDGTVQRLLTKGTTVPTHTTFQLSAHHSTSSQPLLLRLVEGERALATAEPTAGHSRHPSFRTTAHHSQCNRRQEAQRHDACPHRPYRTCPSHAGRDDGTARRTVQPAADGGRRALDRAQCQSSTAVRLPADGQAADGGGGGCLAMAGRDGCGGGEERRGRVRDEAARGGGGGGAVAGGGGEATTGGSYCGHCGRRGRLRGDEWARQRRRGRWGRSRR